MVKKPIFLPRALHKQKYQACDRENLMLYYTPPRTQQCIYTKGRRKRVASPVAFYRYALSLLICTTSNPNATTNHPRKRMLIISNHCIGGYRETASATNRAPLFPDASNSALSEVHHAGI